MTISQFLTLFFSPPAFVSGYGKNCVVCEISDAMETFSTAHSFAISEILSSLEFHRFCHYAFFFVEHFNAACALTAAAPFLLISAPLSSFSVWKC